MNETPTTPEVITYPAPVLEPWTRPAVPTALPRDPKWEREYVAFQRLLPELLKTHRGKYVAIHDGEVVESGDDELAVVRRARQRFGNVALHVDLVAEHPRVFRLPSPRTVRIPSP